MRTIYLGTSDFAATVLRRLADSPHRPVLVVTRPARPKGRGRTAQDPPVAALARALGIELFQPEDINEPDAVERIRAAGAEAMAVCAFGAIVRQPLLSMLPTFNVHPSLLPRWRGAAPIERSIAAGDEQT
ncbi:MAG: methionyl-tRNA formyltransferase, partial [Thermoleophilia bacterium]|nr:methionyl-tRNA formyltransferase [Thermoleophilia bacterium]